MECLLYLAQNWGFYPMWIIQWRARLGTWWRTSCIRHRCSFLAHVNPQVQSRWRNIFRTTAVSFSCKTLKQVTKPSLVKKTNSSSAHLDMKEGAPCVQKATTFVVWFKRRLLKMSTSTSSQHVSGECTPLLQGYCHMLLDESFGRWIGRVSAKNAEAVCCLCILSQHSANPLSEIL